MNNTVAVWDADFIPYYVCHNKKDEPKKSLKDCIRLCDEFINNVNNNIQVDYYIGFLTMSKCFRYLVNSEYKGNRKYLQQPDYLNEVKDYLIVKHNFKYNTLYEADDLVLSFKTQNINKYNCIMISPDKDILSLEGDHYNPKKNEFVKTSKEYAEDYFWKSMMIGDTADNIKGIKGIGPVGAEEIIKNNRLYVSLRQLVLEKYCEIYGEHVGISEFYKNYQCLKIRDDINTFDDVELNIVTSEQEKKDRVEQTE